jgi:ankyrin repeat protein
LSAASAACSAFAAAARQAASFAFYQFFGAEPPPSLPRRMLFRLVDRIADASEANRKDLLGWSAMRGYVKAIKTILTRAPKWADCGAPVTGSTPLTLAVEHAPTVATVELLLEFGADCSRADASGLAPAHIAARLGRDDVLAALLHYDSSTGDCITPDGRTPLMFAAAGGHEGAVTLLLHAESRVNASTFVRDDHGNETALHLAAHHNHVSVAARLLAARANPNAQMRNGRTPLILACERSSGGSSLELVRLLLTRSFFLPVDLSLTTDSGKTALYCACERGLTQVVSLLLQAGADPSQATRRNKLPLYVAAELGHVDIARMLLERAGAHAAADIFVCTTYGTTAMYVASRNTNKAMKVSGSVLLRARWNLQDADSRVLHRVLSRISSFIMRMVVATGSAQNPRPARAVARGEKERPLHLRSRLKKGMIEWMLR